MQEKTSHRNAIDPNKGDEIVISGISGRLPESDNIAQFREHLVNGEDMIVADDRRWPVGGYQNVCTCIRIHILDNAYHRSTARAQLWI